MVSPAIDRAAYHLKMKAALSMPSPTVLATPSHQYPPSRAGTQQPFFAGKPSSTPLSSPHPPYSVGQATAPQLSPGAHRSLQDARTPSPNYFDLAAEFNGDPRNSSLPPRENWSPSSSVKSFAAAIPKPLPMEANPEFEAFRRQVDMNRGKSDFSLTTTHFSLTNTAHTPSTSTPSATQRPRPPRWHTHTSDASGALFPHMGPAARAKESTDDRIKTGADSIRDSAYASGESKRNSEASLNPPYFPAMSRFESPASMEQPFPTPDRGRLGAFTPHAQGGRPALSLSHDRTNMSSPTPGVEIPRAETLPPKPESGTPEMISPAQLHDILESEQAEHTLILDLRVSPQYAQSRVKGALNLCIPTTLLKRATFNLAKLQQTFQGEQDQQKFASWRESDCLVVYDGQSSDKRDAVSAMNMIKKFANEGYTGSATILRGGFHAFAAAYPQLVDTSSGRSAPGFSLGAGAGGGQIPPVIGGVMLPNLPNKANPFFSNIRQNQDLVDGVGQMDLKLPAGIDVTKLPVWLREAAERNDHGKKVSDKFLRIEMTEQSRMRNAYSIDGGQQDADKVQLSGIEQGGKNRYKDILPFEHARVRLQGRPEGACDYVNASHIQAKRSHKRYIASQGPLPATFEDFWSVVWDNDVRVIVMLTAESEGGQLKCHPYWKGNDFGAIRLRVMSEKKVSLDIDKHRPDASVGPTPATELDPARTGSQAAEAGRRRANTTTEHERGILADAAPTPSSSETPYVILRKFALSHASHPFLPMREITQLHYPSWPDFGTPAQPSHLLALVELANVMQKSSQPIDVSGALTDGNGHNGIAGPRAPGGVARNTATAQPLPLSWRDEPECDDRSRPMLVHCSAGCGRTGTFCTVDSVIDMMKRQRQYATQRVHKRMDGPTPNHERAKRQHSSARDPDGDVEMDAEFNAHPAPIAEVGAANALQQQQQQHQQQEFNLASFSLNDFNLQPSADNTNKIDTSWLDDESIDLVARTVEDFRTQRLSMVQSLRQFVLCYETVIEWVVRLQQERSGGSGDGRGRTRSGSLAM